MIPSIYYQVYTVHFPKYWLVRDEPVSRFSSGEESSHKSMLFHVFSGDYIMTLATMLRFFEESIHDNTITPEMRELQLKIIKDVMNDLSYLDKHYVIVPKEKETVNSHNEKLYKKS